MLRSEAINELAGALAEAQGEFPVIPKNKTAKIKTKDKQGNFNGEYTYNYADLADIIAATAKPLSKSGLAVTQAPTTDGEKMILETMLMHKSGQFIASTYPLTGHERPQEMGSEITYARRYTLASVLGIQADEDDDGVVARDAVKQRETSPKAQPRKDPIGDAKKELQNAANDPELHMCQFGKFQGRKLKDVGTKELLVYVEAVRKDAKAKGKIHPQTILFLAAADKVLLARGVPAAAEPLTEEEKQQILRDEAAQASQPTQ